MKFKPAEYEKGGNPPSYSGRLRYLENESRRDKERAKKLIWRNRRARFRNFFHEIARRSRNVILALKGNDFDL